MSFTVQSSFDHIPFQPVLVTGVCRSGKSTVCNLLASLEGVEHADEPWLPLTLPALVRSGLFPEKLSAEVLKASVAEIYNDSVLLRNANFRSSDNSSIWKQRNPNDILYRLNQLYSRKDVIEFAQKKKGVLLLNLPETLSSTGFFEEQLPELKVLHPYRHPAHVAHDIFEKQWYSDEQIKTPKNAQVYFQMVHRKKTWFVPSWVLAADRKTFVEMSAQERSYFYWVTFLEQGIENLRGKKVLNFHFDDFLADPATSVRVLASWIGKKTPRFTKEKISGLKIYEHVTSSVLKGFLSAVDASLQARGETLFSKLSKMNKLKG